jgi:serine/threonine protein kinase
MGDIPQYHRTSIGSYHLLHFIGPGPLSRIYQGEHRERNQQQVVVKIIEAVPLHEASKQHLALQEVRALASLKYRYILPILEAGIDENVPYLVYPYMEAGSLRQRLTATQYGLLPLKEVLVILSQVGNALHFAHQQQIVHANMKPENVLFSSDGEAILADFLVQTFTQSERAARTLAIFSAGYMAPEQFQGVFTPLSDQYALACLAYTLLTGRPPFEVDNFETLAQKHATEQPRSPALLQPERAQHIGNVILKALAKQPGERYPDVAAFLTALLAPPPLEALIDTKILPQVRPTEQASPQPLESQVLTPPEQPVLTLVEQAPVMQPFMPDDQTFAWPGQPAPIIAEEQAPVMQPLMSVGQGWKSASFWLDPEMAGAMTIAQGDALLPVPAARSQPPGPILSQTVPMRPRRTSQHAKQPIWLITVCVGVIMCLGVLGLRLFFGTSTSNHSQTPLRAQGQTQSALPASTPDQQSSVVVATPASTVGSTSVTPGSRPGSTPGSTPTVSLSPTPTLTPAPTATATPPPVVSSGCSVSYSLSSQWNGGFIANLTITNTGSAALKGWNLTFAFAGNQQITSSWNGKFSQSGESITISNADFNSTLASGSSVSPGFQGTWSGSNPPPASFTLNGLACTG